MPEARAGIGFIGAGEISLLHSRALEAIPGARLVGLWNRTRTTAEKRAALYGCKCYGTAEDLVADPGIDAVFVLTNQETHLPYVKLALEAGKHVLVEKPLGMKVSEIEEMKRIALRSGRACVPGHNMIHEEGIGRAHDLIAHGDIGKIVSCYVMYNLHHSEERAATLPGMVRHILTHNLYTMLYLVGKPTRVAAMRATLHYEKLTREDIAMCIVQLENGGLAHLCASFAADDLSSDPWTFMVKVIGTAGTTRYSYQDWVELKKGISHSHTFTAYQATITAEDRYFVDVCLKGGAPRSGLDDAILCQKTVEAVERSIAEGVIVEIR
ncbi:MAG: Gfo/Idh/MocA family oxidoreductase [Spirochaetia bacterium]|jgi:predicted dehydrogenase